MGYTDAMDEQLRCSCGWCGPKAAMLEGLCPRCARAVGVPYGYPPYAHWASASAKPAVKFAQAICSQQWRPCVGSRRVTFLVTVGISFVIMMLLLHGVFAHKHKKRKKDREQRIECILPPPIEQKPIPKVDPLKQVTPPPSPKYGPAPSVVPVPTGERPDWARYRSYKPAPTEKPKPRPIPGVVPPEKK